MMLKGTFNISSGWHRDVPRKHKVGLNRTSLGYMYDIFTYPYSIWQFCILCFYEIKSWIQAVSLTESEGREVTDWSETSFLAQRLRLCAGTLVPSYGPRRMPIKRHWSETSFLAQRLRLCVGTLVPSYGPRRMPIKRHWSETRVNTFSTLVGNLYIMHDRL